jgi:uncharacterized protein YbjT (DUF2867 family)
MVGQGVLRECLLDPEIGSALAIGRTVTGLRHPKLREIAHENLFDLSPIAKDLSGYDACFFCLGVSAAGMKEADYRRITYDLTLSIGRLLVEQNPRMTFLYVSGAGTDSSERGRSMWARVKGKTENDLMKLPFGEAYMLRPGFIQPMHGIKSRTGWYRAMYAAMSPLYPFLKAVFGKHVMTTEDLGRAMIEIAKHGGGGKKVLEVADINARIAS